MGVSQSQHLEQLLINHSTPVPLTYEKFYQPDVIRVFDKLVEILNY